jgi:endonuclease/exonuclease/phosphatase family metal-dependent hydrolase
MSEPFPAADRSPSAGQRPGGGDPPDTSLLRVMSFNVRFGLADDGPNTWDHRKDLLVRTIRRYGPDLLGVQEALDFQMDVLRRALEGYGVVGAGRDDGKNRGEFSAVLFRTDRFEKLDEGHFWFSDRPNVPGTKHWDSELPRMCSWVMLRDRHARPGAGRDRVMFLDTHWDHAGTLARVESARMLRQKIFDLHAYGPAVLVGDFNCTEDDEPYHELLRGGEGTGIKLVDAYRTLHPQRQAAEATFHAFRGGREGSRIDWVIHTDDLQSVEATIDHHHEDGRYPSDHYPVTAVLAWKKQRD